MAETNSHATLIWCPSRFRGRDARLRSKDAASPAPSLDQHPLIERTPTMKRQVTEIALVGFGILALADWASAFQ